MRPMPLCYLPTRHCFIASCYLSQFSVRIMIRPLELFFLPKYSPKLNLIENLWRFIKYEWIDFEAYTSWKTYVNHVEEVLAEVGGKYIINFG